MAKAVASVPLKAVPKRRGHAACPKGAFVVASSSGRIVTKPPILSTWAPTRDINDIVGRFQATGTPTIPFVDTFPPNRVRENVRAFMGLKFSHIFVPAAAFLGLAEVAAFSDVVCAFPLSSSLGQQRCSRIFHYLPTSDHPNCCGHHPWPKERNRHRRCSYDEQLLTWI